MSRYFTHIFILAITLVSSFAFAAAPKTIWEAHSALLSTEQTTDFEMAPIFRQLMSGQQQSDESQKTSGDARLRLEVARHELTEIYNKLSAEEQAVFIQKLNTHSKQEILIYDFDPFSTLLPRIAEIRKEQDENLNFPLGPLGRSLVPIVNPQPVKTAEIVIDPRTTIEINGSDFAPNQFLLTFDDGPSPRTTNAILQTLREFKAKANFFQLGSMIQALSGDNANLEETMYNDGHGLENHSWDHPQMTRVGPATAKKQIADTYDILQSRLSRFSYRSFLFRFPYGDRSLGLKTMLNNDFHATSVMWNIDTLDWKYKDPEVIVNLVKQQISQQDRGIILMHDIHTQTTLATPHILQTLLDRQATVVKLVVHAN